MVAAARVGRPPFGVRTLSIVHGGLKIRRVAHLDVDLDVFGEATHEKFGVLARIEVTSMAKHDIVAIRIFLDHGLEG
jgi:hypothetical protein